VNVTCYNVRDVRVKTVSRKQENKMTMKNPGAKIIGAIRDTTRVKGDGPFVHVAGGYRVRRMDQGSLGDPEITGIEWYAYRPGEDIAFEQFSRKRDAVAFIHSRVAQERIEREQAKGAEIDAKCRALNDATAASVRPDGRVTGATADSCECAVVEDSPNTMLVSHCPLHVAAPDLLAALKVLTSVDRKNADAWAIAVANADAAILRATGGK
jgi:hypothetical protein